MNATQVQYPEMWGREQKWGALVSDPMLMFACSAGAAAVPQIIPVIGWDTLHLDGVE